MAACRPAAGLTVTDAFDLERFVDGQRLAYDVALAELRAGQKRSHWMWFVFPQLDGLGSSAMARRYAISSLAEARAYLAHPPLGPRLRACTAAVNGLEGRTVEQIFGWPDHLKFHSSMTLFGRTDPEAEVFRTALDQYFGGREDDRTIDLL